MFFTVLLSVVFCALLKNFVHVSNEKKVETVWHFVVLSHFCIFNQSGGKDIFSEKRLEFFNLYVYDKKAWIKYLWDVIIEKFFTS